MIIKTKQIIPCLLLVSISLFSKCQNKSHTENLNIINNHIENGVLLDIILVYKDKYDKLPNTLNDVIGLYEHGETSFGFTESSISKYLIDPFSGKQLKYFKTGKNSFILYSVGYDGVDDNARLFKNSSNIGIRESFIESDNESEKGDILIYNYHN